MRNFILGTDWYTDCDDVVAVRILSRFVKAGKANLLGVCINTCQENSVASLKGFFRSEGLDNVAIGIDRNGPNNKKGLYQPRLANDFCPTVTNDEAENGVSLYRRLLASSTEKVDIMEIGFTQVVAELLKSEPDEYSDKNGIDLVKEKVNRLWMMAGKWDVDGGMEYNFNAYPATRQGAALICQICPVPITFLGYEIGADVITGGNKALACDDTLYKAMLDHGSGNGRSSWDPMLVLMALTGSEEESGYTTVSGYASVDPETGANHFKNDQNGPHRYVVKKFENEYYQDKINALIK